MLQACHVCHAQAFSRPLLPALLLRKLTNGYKLRAVVSDNENNA